MKQAKIWWREAVLCTLIFGNLAVWASVYAHRTTDTMRVYFLDIGQGDSIFIDSPTHGRVLLDGGPDRSVLTQLGKILPFGDKRIDVVIESHPDADHITGLVDVVRNFNVSAFMEPGVESPNKVDDALRKAVSDKNIPHMLARRGMDISLGAGAHLLILFPNQDVSTWETNDASIVAKLIYGDKSFLLTGDSTKGSEYKILALGDKILNSDVLKAGHHGSKNSTSILYAAAVSPEYGVISAGAHNKYGHPTREALDVLNQVGAKVVATETAGGLTGLGTIEFDTNGTDLVLK